MRNFNALVDRRVASTALFFGLGAAVLAGCGTEYTVSGTVLKGADGHEYVVPDNAHQPVYASKAACEADVKAHEAAIQKATGAQVDPASVCQPVSRYHALTVYPRRYYVGPMVEGTQEWRSGDVVSWSPVTDGSFAGSGDTLPRNVAQAPDGSYDGEHTSVTEHTGGIFEDPGAGHGGGGGDHGVVDVHPVVVDR